ncbi:MAG TPA: cupin domain-containing protein [bacterium]|nr:cupin domain-containing protein [bacterium]
MKSAAYWIKALDLVPHPEGGYYRETYRSPEIIHPHHLPDRFEGPRNVSTAIYFLLLGHQISLFHRIKCDEVWHFYAGSSLTLYLIDSAGRLSSIILGGDFSNGEVFQAVIPMGMWFGAAVNDVSSFSLIGCTVAPGFDFHDFELGSRDQLSVQFPQHHDLILRLTK